MLLNLRLFYRFIFVYYDFYMFDIVSEEIENSLASFIFSLSFPLENHITFCPLWRGVGREILLSGFAIHADSYGAVVDERHFHIGSKLTSAYGFAEFVGQFIAEIVVKRY